MGTTLFDRLTFQSSDEVNYPNIHKHAFFAALREFARGAIAKSAIASNYNISGGDAQAQALLGLIDAESTEEGKIEVVRKLEDLFSLHEDEQTQVFYPTKASIVTRLGI